MIKKPFLILKNKVSNNGHSDTLDRSVRIDHKNGKKHGRWKQGRKINKRTDK